MAPPPATAPPAAFTPLAALLLILSAVCAAWAAVLLWRRRSGPSNVALRSQQPGQKWRVASGACLAAALAGHVAGLGVRARLGDETRTGGNVEDGISCVLCLLLLVLHCVWGHNKQLWQLAAPVWSAATLSIGALVDAAQAYQHPAHPQHSDASWLGSHYEAAALALAALEACATAASGCCLLAATAAAAGWWGGGSEASQPLLGDDEAATEAGGTGQKRKHKGSGRSKRMRLVQGTLRYLVPDTVPLQIRLGGCVLLLAVGRVVNIALPISYKHVIDRLAESSTAAAATAAAAAAGSGGGDTDSSGSTGSSSNSLWVLCGALANQAGPTFRDVFLPWVALYLCLTFLQGTSGKGGIGLLANLRDLLWIPLQQRACRRVSLDVFAHLLRLDHSFHLHRNTGKVMRVLDRGTSSIQDVLSVLLFNVAPQLLDVVAACVFMALKLQPWTAVIVLVTVITYIPVTFIVTEFRGKVRKTMNKLDNDKEGKASDMLLNYETVKLFGNERFELGAYGRAIDAFQAHEYLQLACISGLNIAQSALVFVGLATGLVVCVRGIVAGQNTVGDAVLFLSLMNQLVAPLSFFGSYYRQIQKGLVDAENMFDLLDTKPAVDDAPGACQLELARGDVAFDNVTFRYGSGPPVLRNVSFSIPGGQTLALVGATGSGKSTVLRLLVRFYDPAAGRVLLDGCDVASCTLASLRQHIAVVPQDTVLFNDTIQYNIRYGRTSASDEEVEEAARVAHIHDSIVHRFPDGYSTLVGERGLLLSGGEKQRVAFARAVLRRPSVLVLDEATSALDSLTERQIQESLAGLRQHCTTIIVAHRLSTVADANTILVFQNGGVAEAGSHAELMQRRGLYASMWQRQQEAALWGTPSQQAELAPAGGTQGAPAGAAGEALAAAASTAAASTAAASTAAASTAGGSAAASAAAAAGSLGGSGARPAGPAQHLRPPQPLPSSHPKPGTAAGGAGEDEGEGRQQDEAEVEYETATAGDSGELEQQDSGEVEEVEEEEEVEGEGEEEEGGVRGWRPPQGTSQLRLHQQEDSRCDEAGSDAE